MKRKVISGLVCITLLVIACTVGCTSSIKNEQTPASVSSPEIRIITENFPPYNTLERDGKAGGQSTMIVKEILRRQNQNTSIEVLPWTEGYRLAQAGPNVALYSTARSNDRENLFSWVGPIGSVDFMLYGKNGSGISVPSLEAAKKAGIIGVVRDDVRNQFLNSENVTDLYLCSDDAECAKKLTEGTIDLWLGSSSAADTARQAGIDPAAIRPEYLMKKTELYIAFSKGTPASTIMTWQSTLDAMKRDGTYDQILATYHTGTSSLRGNLQPTAFSSDTGFVISAVVPLIEGRLNAVLRPLEALALTDDVKSGDWDRILPLLAGIEAKEPSARLWFARTNGSYYTTVDGLTSANLMSRSYFPTLLAGNESVGTIVSSHTTGRNVVVVAVPVLDKGKVIGILGASVYLDSITLAVKDTLALPDTMQFFAVDPAGNVAIHSNDERIFQNDISAGNTPPGSIGAAVKGMLSENAGTLSYDYGGKHWQGQFRKSSLTGWHVAVVSAVNG
jgi:ABC-type amino acid transport substrate-binding protein